MKTMKKTLLLIGCLLFAVQAQSQFKILGRKVPKVKIGKKQKSNNTVSTNNSNESDNIDKDKLKKMLKEREETRPAYNVHLKYCS